MGNKAICHKISYTKLFFFCSLFVFITTSLFQIYVSNILVVESTDLSQKYSHKRALETNIDNLKGEIASKSTLAYVSQRATELGFVPAQELSAIKSLPVAVALTNE